MSLAKSSTQNLIIPCPMFDLHRILDLPPFSLAKDEKEDLFAEAMHDLTQHHYAQCHPYHRILDALGFNPAVSHHPDEIPFLPVRLFKHYELSSVPTAQIIKTMTSSGTTGQAVSRIFLDQLTSTRQTKVLAKIVSHFIGTKRLPMLIVDTRSVVRDRALFSARGAGILGFSMLGRGTTYALDDNMRLDLEAVETFCEKYKGDTILLFGFTSIIWEYFYKTLSQMELSLPLHNGILIHGGGWKKLIDQAVDNPTFNRHLKNVCGIERIHNYYGMAEQTGSIFMECEAGFLHCSIFSDIRVRRNDFSVCKNKESGLIQLLSLLPLSYPGHNLLSEDMGEIIGEDDCVCGRLGKYFRVQGRIKNAEPRGCSDTCYEPR